MLSRDLQRHADLHRALGFKFRTQHALLRLFVSHAETLGDEFVGGRRVIDWAAQAPSAAQRRNRLLTVRRFALALQAEDGRHEVPPADAFGVTGPRRRKPYIYAPEEITRLLAAAACLGPAGSLTASTYETLFGLLAATGMRVSEALALQMADVTADGLVIRATKFQKNRLLPLHETVRAALNRHLQHRARIALYPAHTIIRNFFGSMTRKLSVTSSQYVGQFLGTSLRRKFSIAMLKSLNVV
jgi:integrase